MTLDFWHAFSLKGSQWIKHGISSIGTEIRFERPCHSFWSGLKSRVVNPSPEYPRKRHTQRVSIAIGRIHYSLASLHNNNVNASYLSAKMCEVLFFE